MTADLHIHTTFSDGTLTPEEVVQTAKKAGLKTIAITDHDEIDGIAPAIEEAEKWSIEVIPAVEFTTEIPKAEVHILGYFIDYQNPQLLETLKKIQADRKTRIFKIVDKLDKLGIKISAERVLEIVGHGSAGRPHVARALIEKGYVEGVREAFEKYLDYRAPAYVAHYKLTPEEAIKLILQVRGIPVYAHPGASKCDEIIPDLIKAGLKGIEVYYTGHNNWQTRHYAHLAKKYGLLITGGSDFHGLGIREVNLGDLTVPDELVEKLRHGSGRSAL